MFAPSGLVHGALCFVLLNVFCAAGAHDPDAGSVGALPSGRFDPVLQICHCTVCFVVPVDSVHAVLPAV